MRSLSKKYNKERGLKKAAIFICFTFMMVFITFMFARGEPAKSANPSQAFKAFSWWTREKFFTLLDTGGESDAPKYSLYNANFKRGNGANASKVYLEGGGTIDLK